MENFDIEAKTIQLFTCADGKEFGSLSEARSHNDILKAQSVEAAALKLMELTLESYLNASGLVGRNRVQKKTIITAFLEWERKWDGEAILESVTEPEVEPEIKPEYVEPTPTKVFEATELTEDEMYSPFDLGKPLDLVPDDLFQIEVDPFIDTEEFQEVEEPEVEAEEPEFPFIKEEVVVTEEELKERFSVKGLGF